MFCFTKFDSIAIASEGMNSLTKVVFAKCKAGSHLKTIVHILKEYKFMQQFMYVDLVHSEIVQ